jgi:hypothetical protein
VRVRVRVIVIGGRERGRYRVVSAASIIAKVTRDRLLKVCESESDSDRREGKREADREGTLRHTSQCHVQTILTPIIPFPSLFYSFFQGLAVDRIICNT